MAKVDFKPGNMLYPLPVVMVSCADKDGNSNIITVAWTGTVCSTPPMVSISVRPERFSHMMLDETGEFTINLVTRDLTRATDLCGVKSGRQVDKWQLTGLTPVNGKTVACPSIKESPVNIECKVTQKIELGSHDMYLAEVTGVQVDDKYMDEKGSFHMEDADLVAYSHGTYFSLGEVLGSFGYSVRKDQ
ncbi:MAG: flavin reductase family protein [Lachnospiraceae bacterium]|nr:flavin reductase family protein [Candidatus Merdinaster equi]